MFSYSLLFISFLLFFLLAPNLGPRRYNPSVIQKCCSNIFFFLQTSYGIRADSSTLGRNCRTTVSAYSLALCSSGLPPPCLHCRWLVVMCADCFLISRSYSLLPSSTIMRRPSLCTWSCENFPAGRITSCVPRETFSFSCSCGRSMVWYYAALCWVRHCGVRMSLLEM